MSDTDSKAAAATAPDNTDAFEHTLHKPYKLPTGVMLEKLTLRRPKVRDLKAASRRTTEQVDFEIILASLICQPALTPEDLDGMDLKDYAVIQGFLR